jgi:predicted DNA-binding transcriptional regulator AlpA
MQRQAHRIILPPRLHEYGADYSDTHRRRLEARGEFPRRVPIGDNRIGYLEEEILEWQERRIAMRDAAASETPQVNEPEPQAPEPVPDRAAPKRKPAKKPKKPKGKPGRARPRRVVRFEKEGADDARAEP